MPDAPDKVLDCVGLFCPMPILKTREAMRAMAAGQLLEMLSDDPASEAGSSESISSRWPTAMARIASRVLRIGIGQNRPRQSRTLSGASGITV